MDYTALPAELGPLLSFGNGRLGCTLNACITMRRNDEIANIPQMDYGHAMEVVFDPATLCDTTWHRRNLVMKSWRVLDERPAGMLFTRTSHWLDETESPWISWDPRMALYSESTTPTPGFDSCVFFGRKPRPVVLWRDPRRLIEMVIRIAMNWRFRLYSIMMYLLFDDLTRVRVSLDSPHIRILGGDRAPAITMSLPLLRLLRLNPNVKK